MVLAADGTVRNQRPPLDTDGAFVTPDMVGDCPAPYIHPAERESVCERFEALFSDARGPITTEFRLRDATDTYHRFEARATNQFGSEPVDGVLIVARHTSHCGQTTSQPKNPAMIDQLQQTTQRLLETSEPDAAAVVALQGIESVFNFTVAGIWLANEAGTRLEPVAQTDGGSSLVGSQPVYSADSDSLSWDAFESQTAKRIDDMTEQPGRANPETPIRSELIVPIGTFGILNIASTETGAFSDADLRRVQVWSNTVESALTRLDQIDQLREREAALTRERDRLDDFASIISHDLRNLLNVAGGHLSMATANNDLPSLSPVEDAIERMNDIIDDTLTLARQGDTVDQTEPVDIPVLVADCLDVIDADAATFAVVDEFSILADPDRLSHVFENLFRNAIDHGGADVTVTVGRTDDGFYVADDGPGIPPEDRETVFESGYTTADDGSGLGLRIVEQVVAAHDWSITVTESDTGGAQFVISGVSFY
jgi:K+-sensing histidine kinase KdpD